MKLDKTAYKKLYGEKYNEVYIHKNVENVIRYYLCFLPPRGRKNILDIGAGITAPYRGVLQTRCDTYKTLDIRESPLGRIDYVCDLTEGTSFKDDTWEWGWCVETVEHIPQDKQVIVVNEIIRICRNVVFTFPTPKHESFHDDPGHNEVIVDFNKFNNKFNIVDKTTKTGRAIFVLLNKNKYSGLNTVKNKMILEVV